MAQMNRVISPIVTHEGGTANRVNAIEQLRRSVMSCMLWESEFYEDGKNIAERIHEEVSAVLKLPNGEDIVANIAYEARTNFKLRHAPLWLALALVRCGSEDCRKVVSGVLASVIQRPDELAEFLAMYWKDGKKPLSAQMKKGLAAAFQKFDRYSLSKYANRDGAVKLRDVLFLVHAKPKDEGQAGLWKELASNELKAPDTWEAALSAGADKRETLARLIMDGKLGGLALLRNLRNMIEAKVSEDVIRTGISTMKTDRVLPFRFIAAARYAPNFEPELQEAMFSCVKDHEKLPGKTILLVDISGSMSNALSAKSDMRRIDAACGLAILLKEVCQAVVVLRFDTVTEVVPHRRGFALRDAIGTTRGGTDIRQAVRIAADASYDRIIVITDEQSATSVGAPLPETKAYMLNVASNQNGLGYGNGWVHLDGFSESIVDYIQRLESHV